MECNHPNEQRWQYHWGWMCCQCGLYCPDEKKANLDSDVLRAADAWLNADRADDAHEAFALAVAVRARRRG